MDYIFRYTSSPYVNRNETATFSSVNKKTSPYVGFSQCFIVKYSYGFFDRSVYSANK
jgi:hypothetical protein